MIQKRLLVHDLAGHGIEPFPFRRWFNKGTVQIGRRRSLFTGIVSWRSIS
jgi:hypothetical protein